MEVIDKEELCLHDAGFGMVCVLPITHRHEFTPHRSKGGTEFTNSGKIGLGEIGEDFAIGVKR